MIHDKEVIIEYLKTNRPANVQLIKKNFRNPDSVIQLYDHLTVLISQMSIEEHGEILVLLIHTFAVLMISGRIDVVLALIDNVGTMADIALKSK
ncbi:hypothetical protein KO465_04950 [Candidatus Micrarchaeota archaeon]|jgi:hypothetical protein|nr:hypothetical protein [Candidatus Micrarchaeota archaeon]